MRPRENESSKYSSTDLTGVFDQYNGSKYYWILYSSRSTDLGSVVTIETPRSTVDKSQSQDRNPKVLWVLNGKKKVRFNLFPFSMVLSPKKPLRRTITTELTPLPKPVLITILETLRYGQPKGTLGDEQEGRLVYPARVRWPPSIFQSRDGETQWWRDGWGPRVSGRLGRPVESVLTECSSSERSVSYVVCKDLARLTVVLMKH